MTTVVMWVLMSVGGYHDRYFYEPVQNVESCLEMRKEAIERHKSYHFKCVAVKMRAEV